MKKPIFGWAIGLAVALLMIYHFDLKSVPGCFFIGMGVTSFGGFLGFKLR